jgi:23S rRNA pseudouridine1911/1915/1917 synthase
MVVHPAPGNWSGTLVNALLGRGGSLSETGRADRPGIVHRLDKETSGLLIVARTELAHRSLSAALAARKVVRRYAALIWGHLKSDEVDIDKPLARDMRDRRRVAVSRTGKLARTTIVRLARFDSVDLIRAHLHTGRTHQIRVHLSAINHPVVGDRLYSRRPPLTRSEVLRQPAQPGEPPLIARQALHAAAIEFTHPRTGETMRFEAPLPADIQRALAALREPPPAYEDE